MAVSVRRFPECGSFQTFVEDFMQKNEPCMFGECHSREWKARKLWQKQNGQPDLDHLMKEFGGVHVTVPVADCTQRKFSSHPKTEMKLEDYISYWRSLSSSSGHAEDNPLKDLRLLYLKDWHCIRDFPEYEAYTLLDFFHSDWLNEVWDVRGDVHDDYRFVYMGPKGTWTPFHADVFRSYSWSANVCGHKEWLLYPPGEEENLRDSLGNLPFDVTSPELNNRAKYPNAWKAQQPIRVVQEPGEIIFVPSGWHHQVRNLEDTISINHNWANAFSLKYMWNHLKSELQLVKLEIADCREMEGWEQQCQLILKVSAGMDYKEFFQFLCLVAFPRLQELEKLSSVMFKENCPPESDTANSPLFPDLQHHVLKAFSDSTLTFFQSELVKGMKCQTHADGSPVLSLIGLHSSLIAKDNLEAVVTRCCKCSDSTIDMQAPAQPPLYKLHQLLPLRLQHLLKQKLNTGVALLHKTCFIFRAFELHTIWQTMQEMLSNADFTAVFPS